MTSPLEIFLLVIYAILITTQPILALENKDSNVSSTKICKSSNQRSIEDEIKNKQSKIQSILKTVYVPRIQESYEHALEMGDNLQKIFPYHGCDLTMGHKSLLDCFASKEALNEYAAFQEIEFAYKLFTTHTPIKKIQQIQYNHFFNSYPFDEPTPALKQYVKKNHIQTNHVEKVIFPKPNQK